MRGVLDVFLHVIMCDMDCMLTAMKWIGSKCLAVNEVQVMGNSLLRPKSLGDKHKPVFNIGLILSITIHYYEYVVDILRSGRESVSIGHCKKPQSLELQNNFLSHLECHIVCAAQHQVGSAT